MSPARLAARPFLRMSCSFALPEHDTTLAPTWAVAELGDGEQRWQLLVRVEAAGVDPDERGALDGWEATPHQRFERLLRDTGVFAGLMVTDKALRLIYAPSGETSGHLTFPLRPLGTVAGRPMLGGLKLLLDRSSLVHCGRQSSTAGASEGEPRGPGIGLDSPGGAGARRAARAFARDWTAPSPPSSVNWRHRILTTSMKGCSRC